MRRDFLKHLGFNTAATMAQINSKRMKEEKTAIPLTKEEDKTVFDILEDFLEESKESEPVCNCGAEGHYYKQLPMYHACPKHEPEKYAAEKILQSKG